MAPHSFVASIISTHTLVHNPKKWNILCFTLPNLLTKHHVVWDSTYWWETQTNFQNLVPVLGDLPTSLSTTFIWMTVTFIVGNFWINGNQQVHAYISLSLVGPSKIIAVLLYLDINIPISYHIWVVISILLKWVSNYFQVSVAGTRRYLTDTFCIFLSRNLLMKGEPLWHFGWLIGKSYAYLSRMNYFLLGEWQNLFSPIG